MSPNSGAAISAELDGVRILGLAFRALSRHCFPLSHCEKNIKQPDKSQPDCVMLSSKNSEERARLMGFIGVPLLNPSDPG